MDRKTLESKIKAESQDNNFVSKDNKPSLGSSYTTNLRK